MWHKVVSWFLSWSIITCYSTCNWLVAWYWFNHLVQVFICMCTNVDRHCTCTPCICVCYVKSLQTAVVNVVVVSGWQKVARTWDSWCRHVACRHCDICSFCTMFICMWTSMVVCFCPSPFRKIFLGYWRFRYAGTTCLRTHTELSWMWRTRTTWRPDCGSNLRGRLGWTMVECPGVWYGVVWCVVLNWVLSDDHSRLNPPNPLLPPFHSLFPFSSPPLSLLGSGFSFSRMRCSTPTMASLSMLQGNPLCAINGGLHGGFCE